MKNLILICIIFVSGNSIAQNNSNIAVKLDQNSGRINLIDKSNQAQITTDYSLNTMELDIYDESGDYVGSLVLSDFFLPKNEIDKNEKVKIAKLICKKKSNGEIIKLANVDFVK